MIGSVAFARSGKFLEWCTSHGLDVGLGGSTVSDFTDAFFSYLLELERRVSDLEKVEGTRGSL